jgi:serine/threonine protein kinase
LSEDSQLRRCVALKIPQLPKDAAEVRERFLREARSAAQIHHPNVCPVYDAGEIEGIHYLTMAYLQGKPLAQVIKEEGPLVPHKAVMLTRQLALALGEMHHHGVVHRDVKPSNIMINQRGEPVIMDFGSALKADSSDPRLTRDGEVMGTPAYMAPEQVRCDRDAIGPASDTYSLGVLLYELLTGRRPFQGSVGLVLAQILSEQPQPPSAHRRDLDPALGSICLKAMAKEISDRYPTMDDLVSSLDEWLSQSSDGSCSQRPPSQTLKRSPSKRDGRSR